jgi:phytoene synthase
LRAAGLDPDRLTMSPPQPGRDDAIARVADDLRGKARAALAVLKARWAGLAPQFRPALLPLAMVEPYFRAQSGRSLLVEMADVSPLARVLRIGTARLTGRL